MLKALVARVTVPPDNRSLHPLEQAQMGLIWRVARRVTYIASDLPKDDFIDIDPFASPPPLGKRADVSVTPPMANK
eukprot:5366055-Amphidinium_carterae.1